MVFIDNMDNISIQNNNTNTNTNNADNNTNINSSNSNNIIEIREYIDSDGPEVTKIWISGLKQQLLLHGLYLDHFLII